jgi:hypothetical protein
MASSWRWWGQFTGQSLDQLPTLFAQVAAGRLAHLANAVPTLDQSAQDGAPGNPEDVADHPGKLEVGRLQQLDPAAALRPLVLHQSAPIAGQIAQLADRLGRDKAAADNP